MFFNIIRTSIFEKILKYDLFWERLFTSTYTQ